MGSHLGKDLDDTITSAVNARVEASVIEALASNDVIATYVSAALNRETSDRFGGEKKTFLTKLLGNTVEEMTKKVVAEEIQKQEDTIREEVAKALKKSIGVVADSLVSGFVENTKGSYPSIEVKFGQR